MSGLHSGKRRRRQSSALGGRSKTRLLTIFLVELMVVVTGEAIFLSARAHSSSSSKPGAPASYVNIYVNPKSGSDAVGSQSHPYKTIQDALDVARPGTIIHLASGVYQEEPKTRVDGTAAEPIVVEGQEQGMSLSDRYKTVLYGVGHIFTVQNNDYVLRGFTIDGQRSLEQHRPLTTWPTRPSEIYGFKKSVQAYVHNSHPIVVDGGPRKDVHGTIIDNMWISGAAGECVRFRDGASDGIVEDSVIQWCGLEGQTVPDTYLFHNGEGVYIGTSPKSTSETRHSDDPTNHITVESDRILTFGSECVDIKENSYANVVTSVTCGDNQEPLSYEGSNLEIRGYDNTVKDDVIMESAGFGVKIASDSSSYPNTSNTVEDNVFRGQTGAAIVNLSHASQGPICGNTFGNDVPLRAFGTACAAVSG
jgi:hypothetical protein